MTQAPTRRPCSLRLTCSLDQVAFGRLDSDAARLEVLDAAAELVGLSVQLQQDPAFIARHVGAPDVGDDVELLPQLIDDRLGDQLLAENQLDPATRHQPPATAGTIEISSESCSLAF